MYDLIFPAEHLFSLTNYLFSLIGHPLLRSTWTHRQFSDTTCASHSQPSGSSREPRESINTLRPPDLTSVTHCRLFKWNFRIYSICVERYIVGNVKGPIWKTLGLCLVFLKMACWLSINVNVVKNINGIAESNPENNFHWLALFDVCSFARQPFIVKLTSLWNCSWWWWWSNSETQQCRSFDRGVTRSGLIFGGSVSRMPSPIWAKW